jgi:hypothetical protein
MNPDNSGRSLQAVLQAVLHVQEVAKTVRVKNITVHGTSLHSHDGRLYASATLRGEPYLVITDTRRFSSEFDAPVEEVEGRYLQIAKPTPGNVRALWELFPFTKPVVPSADATFGTGDRLALANIGHVRAFAGSQAQPVLAQQSVRELMQTQRSFADVVAFAGYAVFRDGYTAGFGADGDHLKRLDDIGKSLDAGATMITLDLSEALTPEAMLWSDSQVNSAFARLPKEQQSAFEGSYAGRRVNLADLGVTITPEDARRCAVVYGRAFDLAAEMVDFVRRRGRSLPHIEISIDETSVPTEPKHHFMIVRELERRRVSPSSVAPRFVGEFQKGIDYKGNVAKFSAQIEEHQAVANAVGGYKLSIHSGSDKFSVYPAIAATTQGRLHVKTSGTSWLEAVRTIAGGEPALYRSMHEFAVGTLEDMKRLYHITPDLEAISALQDTTDADLPRFMDDANARQLLHVAYGTLLNHESLGGRIRGCLREHEERYLELVEVHIRRHLRLLGLEGGRGNSGGAV